MKVVYVPWLHMHQPLIWIREGGKEKLVSNLYKMLISKDQKEAWDAKLIARAYKNPAKYVKELRESGFKARIMLDYSGILLESLVELSKKKVLDKVEVEGERIGNPIKLFKEVLNKYPDSIEFAGTAYSHCYFPATPVEDWKLQIEEWRNVFRKIFGRRNLERVKGFWLPEMGIPGSAVKLRRLIKTISEYYEWVILPLQAVEGYEKLSYEQKIQLACQPHLLRVKDVSIPIIFRTPTYFIDQQAGCELNLLYSRLKEAGRIFEKVSPEDMKLLAESAKIWEEKVRFLIDNIDAIIGSKQVFTPPQPPATVTRPVSASLICEDTDEKVRISDYCIIGRDPYTNKVTVYDSRGRILYQLNKVDRYVTRYNPRIGKYGHAILLYEENKGWLIEDEYSTNGTYLNGRLIPPKARVKLRNGDIIEIGSTKFKFILY